jgi:hypothetical protein
MADLSLVAACLAGLLALLYLYKNRRSSPKAPGAPPQVPNPFSAVLVFFVLVGLTGGGGAA